MDWKKIREELARLSEAVDGWDDRQEAVGALERDWALEKLRTLYELIRFQEEEAPAPVRTEPEPDTSLAEEPEELDLSGMLALETEVEPLVPEAPLRVERLEVPVEAHPEPARSKSVPEPVPEPAPESIFDPDPEPDPEPELEPEQIAPVSPTPNPAPAPLPDLQKPAPQPAATPEMRRPERTVRPAVERLTVAETEPTVETTLFDAEPEEDDVTRHRRKQRVIRSLYEGDAAAPEGASDARPEAAQGRREGAMTFEEVTVETVVCDDPEMMAAGNYGKAETSFTPAGNVLGEVINQHVQTLADTIEPPRDVASALRHREPVSDLRQAIGINDKFSLIRDLFGGDGDAYEEVMQQLNRFDNLDDCVIYLTENFAWNPDSESVRLLMGLLERKFA